MSQEDLIFTLYFPVDISKQNELNIKIESMLDF